MIILGLTGSIGMGKSTTLQMFADEGIPTYSADDAVHELYRGKAAPLIETTFPGVTTDGVVDRAKLSAAVMGKPEALKKLEAIIHPLVRQAELDFVSNAKASGAKLIVLDIPLLFETDGKQRVDATLVVSAPLEIQRTRVLARPGMTMQKLDAILTRQMPDADKRKLANYIIDTGEDLNSVRSHVKSLIVTLLQTPKAKPANA
jgi:dephospho-CoA kinase